MESLRQLQSEAKAETEKRQRRKIDRYYPETGAYRRELYRKHLAFFAAGGKHEPLIPYCPEDCDGSQHRERAIIAANRIGKTEGIGAYELTLHLTGQYPAWWTGKRFAGPVDAWAAGDTAKTVREIIQAKLLGKPGEIGTGMVPGDSIIHTTPKAGTPDAIDTAYVRHSSGGRSTLTLKSYDQKRESFQGTEKHVIWLDEEPPQEIYTECLLRTMETGGFPGGLVMLTFTPLMGLSDVVLSFLPGGKLP